MKPCSRVQTRQLNATSVLYACDLRRGQLDSEILREKVNNHFKSLKCKHKNYANRNTANKTFIALSQSYFQNSNWKREKPQFSIK